MALTKRSYCQRLKSLLYAKSPAAIAFSYDGRALTEIWRIMVVSLGWKVSRTTTFGIYTM